MGGNGCGWSGGGIRVGRSACCGFSSLLTNRVFGPIPFHSVCQTKRASAESRAIAELATRIQGVRREAAQEVDARAKEYEELLEKCAKVQYCLVTFAEWREAVSTMFVEFLLLPRWLTAAASMSHVPLLMLFFHALYVPLWVLPQRRL